MKQGSIDFKRLNLFIRATIHENGLSRTTRKSINLLLKEDGFQQKFESKDYWPLTKGKNSFLRAQQEFQEMEKQRIKIICSFQQEFPSDLKDIPDPPVQLFIKGQLPEYNNFSNRHGNKISRCAVAIVGTRRAEEYGKSIARRLASELTSRGQIIVSGLARGIDAAAHIGALEGARIGGKGSLAGIAVLGSGVGKIYPREHKGLADNLVANGGAVISEYGNEEGPQKYFFPERNRLFLKEFVLFLLA